MRARERRIEILCIHVQSTMAYYMFMLCMPFSSPLRGTGRPSLWLPILARALSAGLLPRVRSFVAGLAFEATFIFRPTLDRRCNLLLVTNGTPHALILRRLCLVVVHVGSRVFDANGRGGLLMLRRVEERGHRVPSRISFAGELAHSGLAHDFVLLLLDGGSLRSGVA